MATNLTKDAVLTAMRIVEAEGDADAWVALDHVFSAIVNREIPDLAEAMEEWSLSRGPIKAPLPAYATPSDGRRT
jgi:hypothetical protein